ncbi:hypothetical protein [Actinomadura roseirufa]|uniref:hypothetical protein n=1 Tax=Actinomadura roseirufa TaxID=2094049 RepID=UPI001041BA3A|nr:hypothetical protein [Actinomadura roseirufa]
MTIDSDLREMRGVVEGQLADWVSRRFPDGTSPQWWLSIFESLEISATPFREVTADRRAEDLNLAAESILLAVKLGGVRAAIGAYWMLRIAALALRVEPPVSGLPQILTPDGSAEWALQQIPLTRERAIAELETRRAEYLNADEEFYAPVCGEVTLADEVAFSRLQDVELILSAFPWVCSRVENKEIESEIRSWLEIKRGF